MLTYCWGWLRDGGDTHRADAMTLQCELAEMEGRDPRYPSVYRKMRQAETQVPHPADDFADEKANEGFQLNDDFKRFERGLPLVTASSIRQVETVLPEHRLRASVKGFDASRSGIYSFAREEF